MKNDVAPAMIFGAALVAVVIGAVVVSAGPNLCSGFDKVGELKGAWCLEYWLNRYQTLLGGGFTLLGAFIAAYFVYQQTRVARQQLSVMLGDVEPDFLLEAVSGIPQQDFRLHINNENRRPLEVTALQVEIPEDVSIMVNLSDDYKVASTSSDGRRFNIKLFIQGTRPSASAVSSRVITGWFCMEEEKATLIQRRLTKIVLRVEYAILADVRISSFRVLELQGAGISMTTYRKGEHVEVHTHPNV